MNEDIKELQRRVGVTPDGDFGPKTLAAVNKALDAAGASKPVKPPHARHITTIAVHCSATPEGKHVTAAEIDRWHRAQGWSKIGYHAVVQLNGTVEVGRSEAEVGSHAQGFNANSIAICYVGGTDKDGKPKDTRTPEQKMALRRWLTAKKAQYPNATILGHHDYPGVKKACPSFNAKAEYADL